MAKGQKRSNREAKKPKQPKATSSAAVSATLSQTSLTRETVGPGRDRSATRGGRR